MIAEDELWRATIADPMPRAAINATQRISEQRKRLREYCDTRTWLVQQSGIEGLENDEQAAALAACDEAIEHARAELVKGMRLLAKAGS